VAGPCADVIVVGGGPAGATAARALALGGARVVVLDRATFPRNKPCGGGLTYRAIARFPHLHAALPRISTHAINRLYMEGPAGKSVVVETERPTVIMVRRLEFDALLVSLAREAGAEVVEGADIVRAADQGAHVRLEARDGRTFDAPVVVAADGVYSVVARRLGLNPGWPRDDVALDMMEETPSERLRATDDRTLWVSFAPGRGHGYGYIFPKRGFVNVGVGYVVSSYKTEIAGRPADVHAQFVRALSERGLLEGTTDPDRFTPYQIPIGGPLRATARGRVLLAGDAGGFVNGFSAEGIFFAMVTGELAARAILAGPAEAARVYERLWRREIGAEMRDSRFLSQFVFADLARVDRLVGAVGAFPSLSALLVEYATGADTYRGVRRRFVLQFPAVGAKLALSYISQRLTGRGARAAV
jgi:geranylgeranyl reductase family protein